MNIKTQIQKAEYSIIDAERELRKHIDEFEAQHRSGIVRVSALILTALIAISMLEFGHGDDKRNLRTAREAIAAKSVVFDPAEKNETVREPVKLDDGLRATATTSF